MDTLWCNEWLLALALLVPLAYALHLHLTHGMRVAPKGLPWSGLNASEWFATPKAHLREWKSSRRFIKDGYEKVCRNRYHALSLTYISMASKDKLGSRRIVIGNQKLCLPHLR